MITKPYRNISRKENGVIFLGDPNESELFERHYVEVREKEGRLLDDELVSMLPYLPDSHPLHKEWLHRAATLKYFSTYLSSLKNVSSILDIGCGNGWFCMKMKSILPQAKVYGLDVNTSELFQSARIFGKEEIEFLHGDIFEDILVNESFDLVVMNACIQYFPDIQSLLNRVLELIPEGGEIHILDSPFYTSPEHQEQARMRSAEYFTRMEVEGMSELYHHHSYTSFDGFNTEILYHPRNFRSSLMKLFGRQTSLFPWIRITR